MSIDEKYIVIIGETGSGKSTFVNYLANFFRGGELTRPKIAIPNRFYSANMEFTHDEHAVKDVTKSQTSRCNQYSFKLENVNFHFIDTPGINDTGGLLQDNLNVNKIFDYIQQIPQINAFILIMNGALRRLTVNIRHVLSTIKERIPDVIYDNMLIVMTNCYNHTVNFEPQANGFSNKCPVFYMQNSAFCSPSQSWPVEVRERFEKDFKISMSTMNSIIKTLCKLESQSTITFRNMNDDRNMLKRELHDVRLTLMDLQHLEDELDSIALSADIHSANMEKFQDYLQCRHIKHAIRYTTPYYNTTCSNCSYVCHEKCQLTEIPNIGNEMFSRCWAMQSGKCSKCPGQCKAKDHYHDRSIIVIEMRTVKEVVTSLEQRYHEASVGKSKADMKCKNLQEAKNTIEIELQNQYNKVNDIVNRLQKTCTGFNVTTELSDFIIDLKKDTSTLKSKYVIERARVLIGDLQELCNSFERNSSSFKPIDPSSTDKSINPSPIITVRRSTELQQSQENYHELDPSKIIVDTDHSELERQTSSNHIDKTEEMEICKDEHLNNNSIAPSQQIFNVTKEETTLPSIIHVENGSENFKAYTLYELIKASSQNKSKEIRKELNSRYFGKSLGLLTNEEHWKLCELFVEFGSKGFQDLVSTRDKITEEIREETDDEPFNIGCVDQKKLLQLAAANLLITFRHTRL